jgi:hypothetical protein
VSKKKFDFFLLLSDDGKRQIECKWQPQLALWDQLTAQILGIRLSSSSIPTKGPPAGRAWVHGRTAKQL